METLSRTNIGKFCLSHSLFEKGDFFYLITGIDYIENAYIVRKIKDFHNIYTAYTLEQIEKEFMIFTYFEAIELINKEVNKYKTIYDRLNSFMVKVEQKEFHQNELNELNRIFRAYSESIRQLSLLKIYSEKWSYDLHYAFEYQKTKKAVHRLEKRFFYYFGDDAMVVENIVKERLSVDSIVDVLYYFNLKYKDRLKAQECLIDLKSKLPKE